MIPIKIGITRQGVLADSGHVISYKKWSMVSEMMWSYLGELWFKMILPKHFTHRGATEYNYQKRSQKHEMRKLRLYNHTYPLVFSGEMKRMVENKKDIRAFSDTSRRQGYVRIMLHGPTYLWAYRKDYAQPDKAQELVTVSENDSRLLVSEGEKFLDHELKISETAKILNAVHVVALVAAFNVAAGHVKG